MAPKSLSRRSRIAVGLAGQALANGITLPYYRFYRQNTLIPIQAIAKSVENGESTEMIVDRLNRWRDRKLHEFQFVQVAVWCFVFPRGQIQTPQNLDTNSFTYPGSSPRSSSNRLLLMDPPGRVPTALVRPSGVVQQLDAVHHGGAPVILGGIYLLRHQECASGPKLADIDCHKFNLPSEEEGNLTRPPNPGALHDHPFRETI